MLIALALLACQDPVPQPGPTHLGVWERTIHGLDRPEAVAIDGDGHLWVAEAGAGRVRVFDRMGAELDRFETGLVEPVGLSVCGRGAATWTPDAPFGGRPEEEIPTANRFDGAVLITDRGTGKVWASRGGELTLVRPGGGKAIARTAVLGNADLSFPLHPGAGPVGSERLERKRQGLLRLYENTTGLSDDPWTGASTSWWADAAPHLGGWLLLDRGSHRLVHLTPSSLTATTTGGYGYFEGLFATPGGMDVAEGRVFVADTENHRIQVFDLARIVPRTPALPVPPLYTIGQHAIRPREGKGSLHYPADVAVADDASWGAVCEPWDDRVQIFGRGQGVRPAVDPLRTGLGQASPHYGRRLAIDGSLMAITQPETQAIEIFDLRILHPERRNDPIKVSLFGGLGERLGMFRRPEGMHLDFESRTLLVCDAGNRTLTEVVLDLDPEGELKQDFEMARFIRSYQFEDAIPFAVDRAKGEIFVLYSTPLLGNVVVLDAETWESKRRQGDGPDELTGKLDRPTDLAVSSDGQLIYIACADGVHVFNREHRRLMILGKGILDEPYGVDVAPDGSIVVTDSGAHQVVSFDASGTVLARWGERGIQRDQMLRPAGLGFSGTGELYVLDHGNHRGLITSRDGNFVHAFGSRSYTKPANRPETYKPEDYQE